MVRIFAIVVLLVWVNIVSAMRDPTEPISCQFSMDSRCQSRLILSSVMITPYKRVAIINNHNYAEHDRVGAMTIEKIEPGKVTLVGEKGKSVLLVNKNMQHGISITRHSLTGKRIDE